MWQLMAGAGVALLAVIAIVWYSVRKSATATVDRDAAIEAADLAKRQAQALNQKALDDEAAKRKEDYVTSKDLDAAGAAKLLRDSTSN